MVQIGQSESIKYKQADEVPGKQKRYVEPDFLAVQVCVQPGKTCEAPRKRIRKRTRETGKKPAKASDSPTEDRSTWPVLCA